MAQIFVPDALFLAFQTAVAGRYSLDRELGRGGMGVVYLAREVHLDQLVAIKTLPTELAAQSLLRERFLREAQLAAKRTMLTGPSAESRTTLANARTSMARYPSEQAFFDMVGRSMEHGPPVVRDAGVTGRVASGIAELLSTVTGNDRIVACTNLASTIRHSE